MSKKYQMTVEYTSGRIEVLSFRHHTGLDEAYANIKRMQTVKRVALGDKRASWEGRS